MSIGIRCLFLFRSKDLSSLLPPKGSRGESVSSPVKLDLRRTRNRISMVARCTYKSDDVVVKSPNDKRLYRVLQLDNGLCALIVHDPEVYPDGIAERNEDINSDEEEEDDDYDEDEDDEDEDEIDEEEESDDDEIYIDGEEEPETRRRRKSAASSAPTKKAAAAMCVGVGSFCDPAEAQGLAHFLEHMLFMGSSEFPDENEYDSYLSMHGGSSNAYTETEHTCYHFEVKREALKGALERFSQFFISPLVKTEAMDREILAVDSEFTQVMQNDACRLQQIQCFTSKSSHPISRFVWGNKKSLADAVEKGVNLRELILKMYREWYHGGLMKLCVIGGESLDVLENWVTELFANVRSGTPEKPAFNAGGLIWEANLLYKVEAVKDTHTLELNWPLPCLTEHYETKAEDYLAHLLGHEGEGSLLSFLKSEGLATSLSAGVGDDGISRSSVAYVFGMSIRLTDSGLEKVHSIIGYVYQYLKLIKQETPQEWIFKELQDIGNMEFTFSDDQSPDDYAAELAENMLVYPSPHIIYGSYIYSSWNPDMINNILQLLNPENMRIDVVSKSFHNLQGYKSEPWFGSRYVIEAVSDELTMTWKDPKEVHCSLHLPSKNEFIPRDFSIFSDASNDNYPTCRINEPVMKLWHKVDSTFKIPRLNAYFRINLQGAYANPRIAVVTELFMLLLKDRLNEVLYQASVAKLDTSIALVADKLELKVYGFNEKVDTLLSRILSVSASFSPAQDRFDVIREDLERNLKNANMKPLNHSSYIRLQLLCKSFYDAEEKLAVLSELTLFDVRQSIAVLCARIYVVGLLHGNSTEDFLTHVVSLFKTKLPAQELPWRERYKEQVLRLPPGSNLARDVKVKNPSEKNSVLELYYQIEPDAGIASIRTKALMDLFCEIIEEPLFNKLRTQEQLGYVVECGPRVTYRVFGLCFCIQSAEYSPLYLQERVDLFINGLRQTLEDLDDVPFESYKKGLVAKLLEKDFSLQDETNRHWTQIVDNRTVFDSSEREAECVEALEKRHVVDWYNTYLQEPSVECRRLAIRVWGCDAVDSRTPRRGETAVDDVAAFKSASVFYPSFC